MTSNRAMLSRACISLQRRAICSLFCVLALAACKSRSIEKLAVDEQGKVPLTLQLNWVPEPEFGGFYAAVNQGLYEKAGLDVELKAGAAGVQTWRMVATGKVPLAIASAGEVLRARLKDADLVAVFAVYQKNPMALMVHEDSGVASLEDVFRSGKVAKVAMEADLPYGLHLKQKYGFDKVQVLQHGNNLSLFLQDKGMAQQCFIFSEPVSARLQGVAVRAFSIGESGFDPYMSVVITSQEFLDKNRDVVERFVRASRAGWRSYQDDPEPTNLYMTEHGATMTLEAMKLAAELQRPYIEPGTGETYLGHMARERWQTTAEQLHALGGLDEVPEVDRLFMNIEPE